MNNLKWFGLHRTRLKRGQALLALSGLWKFPRTRIVHKDSALTFFSMQRTPLTLVPFHIPPTRVLKCKLNSS